MTLTIPDTDLHAWVPLALRRVVNRTVRPFGVNPFPRVFQYALAATDSAAAFDRIYAENQWGSAESASGVGSELATTARYRAALAGCIRAYGFRTLFDAPCGDLHWMPEVVRATGIAYQGGDISPALVAAVQARSPEFALGVFDITRDAFPEADVWQCRDCLFHLPTAAIQAALKNFARSSIPYALLTTHRARLLHRNLEVRGTGFRFLDLERAPFFLPRPERYLADYRRGVDFPRYVGLWTREQLAEAAARW